MSTTIPSSTSAKLKCIAGKGMFPHESGVLIRGVDQFYESIIDSEFVFRVGEGGGTGDAPAVIQVEVVKVNGEKTLVELPRQVVSGGRRIWVPNSEVER